MKQVASKVKLELGSHTELLTFALTYGSDLDKATKAQLERGHRIMEILKQPQYQSIFSRLSLYLSMLLQMDT